MAAQLQVKGLLYKRQRGQRSKDLQKLKFQERFCQLTATSFEYYKGRKAVRRQLRGEFLITQVRIVEQVHHFDKKYCFQIGDNEEIMYLAAKSEEERNSWMQAFRKAASDKGNNMLTHYHPGLYGFYQKNKWSCCNSPQRSAQGCLSIHQSISKTKTFPQLQRSVQQEEAQLKLRSQSANIPSSGFQEEEISAKKTMGLIPTTQSLQSLQSVPEVKALLIPVKDDPGRTGEVPVRHQRSRTYTQDSGYSSSRCASKNVDSVCFYVDSEDEVPDNDQYSYTCNIIPSFHSQAVTALAFCGSNLLSGSRDQHVLQWDVPSSTITKEVKVSSPVLALDVWSHYLAIGSTSVQLVDLNSKKLRRIMVIDMDSAEEEDPLESSVLSLVAYTGTEGMLATASVTSNMVKLWNPPHPDESIIRSPKYRTSLGESETCTVWSLSASYNPESPWLAVGVCFDEQDKPLKKFIRLIDWKKPQRYCYSFQTDSEALHSSFSPDGKHLAIGYSARVDIHNPMSGDLLYYSSTDSIISSVSCYLHQSGLSSKPHLAVGLTTGEVQVFELCTETMRSSYTFPRPENESAATAIVYSGDMKSLAIGHQNGKIHLWKDSLDVLKKPPEPVSALESNFCPNTIFTRLERQTFDYEGGEYISEADEFQLIVPEGAIPKSTPVTIEFGVSPYGPFGPFKYPDDCRPISANVWFCATPQITFLKPVEIKLPHFADCKDETDCKALTFLKADHIQKNEKVFQFSKTDGKTSFTPRTFNGSLYTDHFCVYCTAEFNRYDTDNANFSLVIARPKQPSQDEPFQIHCCLTYMLPTCYELIKEQLSEKKYHVTKKIVRFADDQHALRISINKDDAVVKGWSVSLVSEPEIWTKEVCFWDAFKTPTSLVLACEESMYPPRFTIEVSGKSATGSSNLKLNFEGSIKALQTEIPLEVQAIIGSVPMSVGPSELVVGNNPGRQHMLTDHHTEGGNPVHRPPLHLQPAIQPFK